MIVLHEKTTKLKVPLISPQTFRQKSDKTLNRQPTVPLLCFSQKRGLKLQQQKQKEELEKEQRREKELERERQLVAKPAKRH